MDLVTFQQAGRVLVAAGLVHGSSGNMSVRRGETLFITRSGSNLGALADGDLVKTGLHRDYPGSVRPSSEIAVHRAVYRQTGGTAVVHAHPPWAITLSMNNLPMPPGVEVIGEGGQIIPGIHADEIASALKASGMVIVRAHGSFAVADNLADACALTLELEKRCRVEAASRGLPLQIAAE